MLSFSFQSGDLQAHIESRAYKGFIRSGGAFCSSADGCFFLIFKFIFYADIGEYRMHLCFSQETELETRHNRVSFVDIVQWQDGTV